MKNLPVCERQRQADRKIWQIDYLAMHSLNHRLPAALTRAHGALLDIGCGHRPYQAWLPAAVTRYVGLDHDSVNASPDVVGDALRLPFVPNSFDAIFSTQALEHLSDPFQACAEMARVLRPGGLLILSAPQGWREHEAPHDYFRFTRYGLRRVCEAAGLSVRRLDVAGAAWSHLGQSLLTIMAQTPLARVSAPLALIVNSACQVLDALWRDDGEAINRVVVAEKPL